ncbi:MAG: c-type cytochrome [Bacteroidetes bacterium]|nr:c-type cytochrome [Bacteroidota bacterium]MBS1539667.1 c-type cytochrome [Bacteroidota bacterium]
MKKLYSILLLTLVSLSGVAQQATQPAPASNASANPLQPYYVAIGFIVIVFILTIVVLVILVRTLNLLTTQLEKQRAEAAGKKYVPTPTWWQSLTRQLNDSVPVEEEASIEMAHSYDGIRELDNHLPPWWKWLFYGTIIFGIIYLVVYHVTDSLPLMQQEYETEVALAQVEQQKNMASKPQAAAIDESTLVYSADATIIGRGKEVFVKNACGSCHGSDGGGNNIGPNLTDQYWLHGGGIKNVFHTIKDGVVEKGMPAWGKAMSINDVRDVTFFVLSLQGTKPASPKAPQGELYKPEKSDSSKTQAAAK